MIKRHYSSLDDSSKYPLCDEKYRESRGSFRHGSGGCVNVPGEQVEKRRKGIRKAATGSVAT